MKDFDQHQHEEQTVDNLEDRVRMAQVARALEQQCQRAEQRQDQRQHQHRPNHRINTLLGMLDEVGALPQQPREAGFNQAAVPCHRFGYQVGAWSHTHRFVAISHRITLFQ